MKLEFYEEMMKIWNKVYQEDVTIDELFKFKLDKNLLYNFHIGNFYYFFFDIKNLKFKHVSPEIKSVLGYNPKDINIGFIMSIIHPDDQATFLNFEYANVTFFKTLPIEKILKYKVSCDYRVINKTGETIRILQQTVPLKHDEDKNILLSLVVHTDISHLKKDNKSTLSYIGLDGEPSYIDVDVEKNFKPSNEIFTKRENEIVNCLITGLNSEEIARKLFISKLTVDTHRKNILIKTNTKSTIELVVKVISEGLF